MIGRFRELVKTKKIVRVVKLEGNASEIQFEGKVTLRLSHAEAKVLEKEISKSSQPVNLNAHALSQENPGKKQ